MVSILSFAREGLLQDLLRDKKGSKFVTIVVCGRCGGKKRKHRAGLETLIGE